MPETTGSRMSPLLMVASVFVLGIGAQWLAWRLRLPSILLLLAFGILAGPVLGILPRETLDGDWLFPFVSLSVGIILFEGGLSLRFDEFREVGRVVIRLITLGVLVTGVLAALGLHYLVGMSWEIAVVVGTLLTVTGPTVVLPLLRYVRPSGRVGVIAKWEGITIDPIGAILAVLVLEAVVLLHEPEAHGGGVVSTLLLGILQELVVGVGVAALAAAMLILLLHRRLVPDWLQNPLALMTVVTAFALANTLMEEAGLLEATLLGIIMANQRWVSVERITEFKEDLGVLLISFLFIVLSARLDLNDIAGVLTAGPLLFLGLLMLVVRPLAVAVSSLGTGLSWREQAFLAWLAPRGIVAASVASLFALRLAPIFPAEAERIVPLVFLVIVGTVAVYGLTLAPLARWLGLAQPDPQGVLFVGAHPWARAMASALETLGIRTLLVDANPRNVREARRQGLNAQNANVLSEGIKDSLDLSGIGRLVAVTSNDEVNTLAALHFGEVFSVDDIYQLPTRTDGRTGLNIPQRLRARPLFADDATYLALSDRFDRGDTLRVIPVDATEPLHALVSDDPDEHTLPLFVVRGRRLLVVSTDDEPMLMPDDRVIVLTDIDLGEDATVTMGGTHGFASASDD